MHYHCCSPSWLSPPWKLIPETSVGLSFPWWFWRSHLKVQRAMSPCCHKSACSFPSQCHQTKHSKQKNPTKQNQTASSSYFKPGEGMREGEGGMNHSANAGKAFSFGWWPLVAVVSTTSLCSICVRMEPASWNRLNKLDWSYFNT